MDAIPKLSGCLAKLFSLDDDDNNSVEEIQLLIDTVIKTGGIRAVIKKLNNNSTSYNKAVILSDNDKICAKYNKSKEGVMPIMYQVYATADDSDDNTIT